jgi:cytochrome P450
MTEAAHQDWDPRSPEVLADQIHAYDELRATAALARSDYLGWSVLRHADVLAVLHDPGCYSSVVSAHLNVPSGMDPPEHTAYRAIVDRYFTPEIVEAFEPACRRIAAELVASLPRGGQARMMSRFAEQFAARVQSAYLGWPAEHTEALLAWTARNREATLARDREAMAALAADFDRSITELVERRRSTGTPPQDLTTRLLGERIDGRPLTDAELVSILRNWTVGELGTISASVGILAHYLAGHPDVQDRLRAEPEVIGPAVDEILRIHPPLVANRRVTTCPVELGGTTLPAGERLTLLWASANRDERVFGDPDAFDPDRDPRLNLLYGAGIHVCPGAPLARLELRVIVEELLGGTTRLDLDPGEDAVRAIYPGSGFTRLPMRVH